MKQQQHILRKGKEIKKNQTDPRAKGGGGPSGRLGAPDAVARVSRKKKKKITNAAGGWSRHRPLEPPRRGVDPGKPKAGNGAQKGPSPEHASRTAGSDAYT